MISLLVNAPMVYLNHAWSSTQTVFGKAALVLFYLLIWLTIISCVITLIDPTSQGASCMYDELTDQSTIDMYKSGSRMFSVVLIAFLFYADKAGLHAWNVAIVTIVVVYATIMTQGYDMPDACPSASWNWIWGGWAILTLILTILEERLGGNAGGSAEETQPINV